MSSGIVASAGAKGAKQFGILYELVGDVGIVVMGPAIDVAEFDAYVQAAVKLAPSVRVVLVVPGYSADLTAGQRAKLRAAGLLRSPTAVLTHSAIARSVMTAIRWMGGTVAAFKPDRFDEAFDYLKIAEALRPQIRARIAAMRPRVRGFEESTLHEAGIS